MDVVLKVTLTNVGLGVFPTVVYSPLFTTPQIPIKVFVDNLYTSHDLLAKLKVKEVVLIGTMNMKMLPKVLKPAFKGRSDDRYKCRWSKCNNVVQNYCKACQHKNGPLYLCGKHFIEHKRVESGKLDSQ